MTDYKFSVHIPARTGLPRDDAINSFYATPAGAVDDTDLSAAIACFENFYTLAPSGHGNSVSQFFSADRDPGSNKCRIDVYEIPATRGDLGTPIYSENFTWVPYSGSSTPLPDQVAACMSYDSIVPGATHLHRRRGRIFLGPLNSLPMAGGTTSTDPQSVAATYRSTVTAAAQELYTALQIPSPSWIWGQWSPTDWLVRGLKRVYMDDRFDTQRRRLERPSTRTVVVLT